LPPGKLFSEEFYRTATPAEVKAEIGGRSLAGEYFIEKKVSERRGIYRELYPFLSDADVERSRIYPLAVAARTTPYPEVLVLLVEAGAAQGNLWASQEELSVWLGRHPDARALRMLLPYLPQDPCEVLVDILAGLAERGGKTSMWPDIYQEVFPDANLNCREKRFKRTPLEMFIRNNDEGGIQTLLRRGADLEFPVSGARGETPLAYAVNRDAVHRYSSVIALLLKHGAKVTSLDKTTLDKLKNRLVEILKGGLSDLRRAEKREALRRVEQAVDELVSPPLTGEKRQALVEIFETASARTGGERELVEKLLERSRGKRE
jgi:hypothetical protein